MKPTVSAITAGPQLRSSTLRTVGSSVANSWLAAYTPPVVSALKRVDLPALV